MRLEGGHADRSALVERAGAVTNYHSPCLSVECILVSITVVCIVTLLCFRTDADATHALATVAIVTH